VFVEWVLVKSVFVVSAFKETGGASGGATTAVSCPGGALR
jgi:hypothetical protein